VRSHVLVGKVRHRRARPFTYELEHDVWYLALDTREIDAVVRSSRLLTRNRTGILAFRDADHLVAPATDIDRDIRAELRGAGEVPDDWSITLVTNVRVLGYVFNPASFYLCRDRHDRLRVVVVEVHNTFGERHLYVLRRDGGAAPPSAEPSPVPEPPFTSAMAKAFFVSPFISADGRYTVHVRDEDRLRIAIVLRQDGVVLLATSVLLERRPLRDRTLLGLVLRRPLMTQRTIGLIHWHAVRLWLKGAPFFRHGTGAQRHAAHGDGTTAVGRGVGR
jgi:DUF1365 family protein